MPSRRSSHFVTVALLGFGMALWAYSARNLGTDGSMHFKPNPLGLKMSAYGQVIGMAMQGPIDLFWHKGEAHHHHHHHDGDAADCEECRKFDHDLADHTADHADTCPDCGGQVGHHAPGCPGDNQMAVATASTPLRKKVKGYLQMLGQGASHRTNPNPDTPGHKFYLRRQIENRLRIAYEFDPSNYGTYNAYHLFLSESSLGTTKAGIENAMRLSRLTIDYCLRQPNDPRPALTAAAAAHDILALMFREHIEKPRKEYERILRTEDLGLARYIAILRKRNADGTLNLISATRQAEMTSRFHMLLKLREADDATIRRIFARPSAQQAARNQTSSKSGAFPNSNLRRSRLRPLRRRLLRRRRPQPHGCTTA